MQKKMKMASKYRLLFAAIMAAVAVSCNSDTEDAVTPKPRGVNYVEAFMENWVYAQTRANLSTDDGWSVTSFSTGDAAGLYCVKGIQNPDNPDDYSLPAYNAKMSFEGASGSNIYRFGSSEVVMDAILANGSGNSGFSMMYYPYYADMPDYEDTSKPGIPIRLVDERDGIEKCLDFFGTYIKGDNSGTASSSGWVGVSNGVLAPKFYRFCASLILQRGEGFENPNDSRIWVVMQNPHTHIRVNKSTSNYNRFTYDVQYYTTESQEELMIDIMEKYDLQHNYEPNKKLTANKYAVWQTWEGLDKKIYVTIPPRQTVYYILIQDNNGRWQCVTDFYLTSVGSKSGLYGWRYTLKVELQGVDVVARPVSVERWDDEINITDNRKVGISTLEEYINWVSTYNTYTQTGRDESYVDELKKYGDSTFNEVTEERKWTFYINDNIEFQNNDFFPTIKKLEDQLEGSSTYTNYNISNLRSTMIEELAAGGGFRALDLRDIYLVQRETDDVPFGALVGRMTGGTIANCNILNGVVISENEVGIIAGEVSGGALHNCTVSGNVIGSASLDDKGLFGKLTEDGSLPEESGNKTSGLKFIRN